VAGHTAITRGAGTAFTISDANGFNEKWEFGYTTSPVESYVDVTTNATTTWRQGVDNSGEYFFSATGARSGADFVLEDDGDLVLDEYPNVRDDVGAAPINHLFTDAFGTIQSSPVGVYPFSQTTNSNITVDKYDRMIRANATSSNVTVTLPSSAPTGKTYFIGHTTSGSNTVTINATGVTTVDGSASLQLGESGSDPICLTILVYDGSGDYVLLYISCPIAP